MENTQCTTGKCGNITFKCAIPVVAVFFIIFAYQWLFHGIYMMPAYEATASMWRNQDEMKNLWWVCISTKLVMAAVISCLYCCFAKGSACGGKCPKQGAKFGFKIGLLLGAYSFASYAWMPISLEMALKWLTGEILMGVIIGVALSYIYRICKKGECATA